MNQETMNRFDEHVIEAMTLFDPNRIIGVFLEGSQNYGLDTSESDIDTKVLLTPSFEDIALNKPLRSGTHTRTNEEHISYKDIRLYCDTLRKQNLNFIEILFTKYLYINPLYEVPMLELIVNREKIGYYNPYRAIMAMTGMAERNYKLITHYTESNTKYFDKYGYYPKALSHVFRVWGFLRGYLDKLPYEECIKLTDLRDFILTIKTEPLEKKYALELADGLYENIQKVRNLCLKNFTDDYNKETEKLLQTCQKKFIEISIKHDFDNERMVEVLNEKQ